MTTDEALDLLQQQICPLDQTKTQTEIDYYDDGGHADEICKEGHRWPYHRWSDDPSTNAFDGELDIEAIRDQIT